MVPCEPVSTPSSSPAPGTSHPLNHPTLSPVHFEETPRHAVVLSDVFQRIALKNKSSLKDAVMISVPLSIFWGCEEAEVERFCEDLQDLLELTPKKDVLFIIGDSNAKVRSQETPGVTGKFGLGVQNEAGQRLIVLPRECTRHNKHPLPTTQENTLHMDITRWSTLKSDGLYSLEPKMEKLYTVSKNKTGS